MIKFLIFYNSIGKFYGNIGTIVQIILIVTKILNLISLSWFNIFYPIYIGFIFAFIHYILIIYVKYKIKKEE